MTEHERDERDLKILAEREVQPNTTVAMLAKRHKTTARYIDTLLEEALADD